jgi:hypothetical protein
VKQTAKNSYGWLSAFVFSTVVVHVARADGYEATITPPVRVVVGRAPPLIAVLLDGHVTLTAVLCPAGIVTTMLVVW